MYQLDALMQSDVAALRAEVAAALDARESAEGVSLHFAKWGAVAMFTLGLGRQVAPSAIDLATLALAGICGGGAQVSMTKAYGLDKAARVGAIGYSGVVMSQLLAVLVLAELPTPRQLGGAAMILLCDLPTRFMPSGMRLGVVTALAGGPFLLWLLRRRPC